MPASILQHLTPSVLGSFIEISFLYHWQRQLHAVVLVASITGHRRRSSLCPRNYESLSFGQTQWGLSHHQGRPSQGCGQRYQPHLRQIRLVQKDERSWHRGQGDTGQSTAHSFPILWERERDNGQNGPFRKRTYNIDVCLSLEAPRIFIEKCCQ